MQLPPNYLNRAAFCKDMSLATSPQPTAPGISKQKNILTSVLCNPITGTNVGTLLLGFTIMAVVTLIERAIQPARTGFALEWALLAMVALVSFGQPW